MENRSVGAEQGTERRMENMEDTQHMCDGACGGGADNGADVLFHMKPKLMKHVHPEIQNAA